MLLRRRTTENDETSRTRDRARFWSLENLQETTLNEARVNQRAQEEMKRAIMNSLAETQRLNQSFRDVLQGRATHQIHLNAPINSETQAAADSNAEDASSRPRIGAPSMSFLPPITDSLSVTPTTASGTDMAPGTEIGESTLPGRTPSQVTPIVRLSRAISSVHDLWREYKEGLGGNPSVESSESRGDRMYRSNDTERRFLNRRMSIWSHIIETAIERNVPEEAIVTELEQFRLTAFEQPKSLDWLSKDLDRRKKGGESRDFASSSRSRVPRRRFVHIPRLQRWQVEAALR